MLQSVRTVSTNGERTFMCGSAHSQRLVTTGYAHPIFFYRFSNASVTTRPSQQGDGLIPRMSATVAAVS
jgi:hypothetical protein